jgi:hypothetical protein
LRVDQGDVGGPPLQPVAHGPDPAELLVRQKLQSLLGRQVQRRAGRRPPRLLERPPRGDHPPGQHELLQKVVATQVDQPQRPIAALALLDLGLPETGERHEVARHPAALLLGPPAQFGGQGPDELVDFGPTRGLSLRLALGQDPPLLPPVASLDVDLPPRFVDVAAHLEPLGFQEVGEQPGKEIPLAQGRCQQADRRRAAHRRSFAFPRSYRC